MQHASNVFSAGSSPAGGAINFMSAEIVLLNAYCNYINRVHWQEAVRLLVKGVARPFLGNGKDVVAKLVRSPSTRLEIPPILVLNKQIRVKYQKHVPYSKTNIGTRDNWSCQYCGIKLRRNEISIDHIIPRSRGGKNTFENCVCCCKTCNNKKDNKTPTEARMVLLSKPYSPTIGEFLQLLIKEHGIDKLLTRVSVSG